MPPTLDPFDLLGLPPTFDLDPAALRRAYLAKAQAAHPDRPPAASPPDPSSPAAAFDPAAVLNHAHRTLQDPESRAEALLIRLGGAARNADKSLPAEFLPQIMEIREQLEAALASGDPAQREHWEAWANSRRAEHARAVSSLFRQHAAAPSPVTLSAIRRELNVWRYTERLLEQLDG